MEFTNADGVWTSTDGGVTWQLTAPSQDYLDRRAASAASLSEEAPTIDDINPPS